MTLLAQEVVQPAGLWPLFLQSFDAFTVVLLLGSVVGIALVFICMFEVREQNIIPKDTANRLRDLVRAGRWEDLSAAVRDDDSFLGRVVRPALAEKGRDRSSIREAAELAASEESARWFRRIDLLSVIGNLGPLVGLAGTVWGMILAFTSLHAAGGQADPSVLSLGISKALFHTLLGLCLSIPCLLTYGVYRNVIDRLCTRGTVLAAEIVEHIPAGDAK